MPVAHDEPLLERVALALHGRYDIERELDRGATAVVFVAFDRRHDRRVAIKVLRPELARTVGAERFLREVRTAAQLQHPHIVPVFDSGVSEDLYYFVMPLVAGESLQARLRKERQLPLRDALRIAREIADALAHAHMHGLVHRDVKPANVLISGDHVAVTDFGIARALSEPDDQRLTGGGVGVGTPAYMSPEQASGERIIDGRSDVYALGCVLYEMLVGTPPFSGSDPQVVLSQHRHDAPSDITVVRPDVPDDVNSAVRAMLAKVPADRLRSADVARERIDDLLLALATNELHTRRAPRKPARKRSRWPILTMAVVVAVVGGGLLVNRLRPRPLDPNRILVFPLQTVGGADTAGDGLAVATYIGYALDGTRPLRWVEAYPLIDEASGRGPLRQPEAVRLARSIGAGHYIDGTVVRERDSVRVLLTLHSVAGDSTVRRAAASAPLGASAPQLGVTAVATLVPLLVEPGRQIDFSPLRDRAAPAIAKFLQGERAFRASRLADALTHYREAVALDSAFALAAIKGALAARALDRDSAASELHAVATRHIQALPPRHASYAQGLGHYLAGDADSALAHFQDILARDPSWSDVWMALAETYNHLLPNVSNADSLAGAAYGEAIARDSAMVLARLHLAEHDLHQGKVTSPHVRYALAADTGGIGDILTPIRLAIGCIGHTRPEAFWERASAASAHALVAGKLLAVGASQPACARHAFWRVLNDDSADVPTRWGALLTLHGLLIATNDTGSLPSAYAAAAKSGLPAWPLRLLAAAAGHDDLHGADSIATARGSDFQSMNSATLWLRATWSARRGDSSTSRDIVRVLQERARASRSVQDSLLAASTGALAAYAARDTSAAIAQLQKLRPHAPRADITWQPFAGLGLERLTLAELLLAKGRYADAMRVAATIDAPEPVTYLLYYRSSLNVRLRAARALGRAGDVRELAARLDRLRPAGAALRAAG